MGGLIIKATVSVFLLVDVLTLFWIGDFQLQHNYIAYIFPTSAILAAGLFLWVRLSWTGIWNLFFQYLMIFFLIFVFTELSAPMIFTILFGSPVTYIAAVSEKSDGTARKGCRYRIDVAGYISRHCITENAWREINIGQPVRLIGKESQLGSFIQEVQILR